MANESEKETIIDSKENNEEVEETTEETIENEGEKKPEKTVETPEAKKARLERQLEQHNKKFFPKAEEKVETKPEKTSTKSSEIDYGKLAFHNSKSDVVKIDNDADVEFLQDTMTDTGKSQETILASKWFQAELKEKQEARASNAAIPKGTKRSGQSARDTVEYWEGKNYNEIPDQDMRLKVLNKQLAQEKGAKGNFSQTPIISA